MSFDTVIYNPTGSDIFPYQSYVGFFPEISNNYNTNDHMLVPGINIKIDAGTAYVMNLISYEEFALENSTSQTANNNKMQYTDKQYNWHLCRHCLEWIAFLQCFIVEKYSPDDLILNETVVRNKTKIIDHFYILEQNSELEYDICSYGNCYAQQIIDYDFVGLNPQYKTKRQKISNQQIQNYFEYLTRIQTLRTNYVSLEDYLKFNAQGIGQMFIR